MKTSDWSWEVLQLPQEHKHQMDLVHIENIPISSKEEISNIFYLLLSSSEGGKDGFSSTLCLLLSFNVDNQISVTLQMVSISFFL